jgi:alpha-ribazole phosphatase CobZ
MVLPRTSAIIGRLGLIVGESERNGMDLPYKGGTGRYKSVIVRDRQAAKRLRIQTSKYLRTQIEDSMFEIEQRLQEKGVERGAIVASAMELYVSHGLDAESAAVRLDAKIQKALEDPNVSSLLLGAILLEDELYWRRRDSEIADDPVFLLSDEIIGMAIAEVIGGTYARFEFTRYDQKKPGILKSLGPFLDDAVAGLIAGCTSRLYSESM